MKSYAPLKPKPRRERPDWCREETAVLYLHTSDTEFGRGWAVWTDSGVKYTSQGRDGKYRTVEIRKEAVIKWKAG
jgi:hypothetical protein